MGIFIKTVFTAHDRAFTYTNSFTPAVTACIRPIYHQGSQNPSMDRGGVDEVSFLAEELLEVYGCQERKNQVFFFFFRNVAPERLPVIQ